MNREETRGCAGTTASCNYGVSSRNEVFGNSEIRKTCVYCGKTIKKESFICSHCGNIVEEKYMDAISNKKIMPVNFWAILALACLCTANPFLGLIFACIAISNEKRFQKPMSGISKAVIFISGILLEILAAAIVIWVFLPLLSSLVEKHIAEINAFIEMMESLLKLNV